MYDIVLSSVLQQLRYSLCSVIPVVKTAQPAEARVMMSPVWTNFISAIILPQKPENEALPFHLDVHKYTFLTLTSRWTSVQDAFHFHKEMNITLIIGEMQKLKVFPQLKSLH